MSKGSITKLVTATQCHVAGKAIKRLRVNTEVQDQLVAS